MSQFIRLKSLVIFVGVVALGGATFVALRHTSEVQGDAEPVTLSETYTHPELGFSFQYSRAFRANEIPQAEGSAFLLVEDSSRPRQGFQVFSMPYDEHLPYAPVTTALA